MGYTYDETVWDVYVKVDEEMNESTGMHQYTVTYRNQYDECDPYEDHPVFNNIYVAPEEPGTLTVSKVVTGNKAPATPINYEFELTLPQEMTFTANGEEVTAENGVYQFTLAW